MRRYIVAIVGRPNVGKSTLFNRLCRAKKAIVDYTPGVTRDRLYHEVEWSNRRFVLVDTGGIIPESTDEMDKNVRLQAELAVQEADFIVFLVDAQTGALPADEYIAQLLRPHAEKVFLAANKCDNEKIELDVYDFLRLGLGEALPISATSGRNTGNFLDELLKRLPLGRDDEPVEQDEAIKLAIVGKPNVGKSSLTNRLLGQDKMLVSDIPGTTRDAVDTPLNYKNRKLIIIDTAGLRRKNKIKYGVEYFAVFRTLDAVDRCDTVVLMMDAREGVTNQDQKVARYAVDRGKNLVLVFNKWDLMENKTTDLSKKLTEAMQDELPFCSHAPVVFTSVEENQRLRKILDLAIQVDDESRKRIPTAKINEFIEGALRSVPPSNKSGRLAKIFYGTQQDVHPPFFVLFVNDADLFEPSWRRYLENRLRANFGFAGCPIKMRYRSRKEENLREQNNQ